ncbi:MAG: chemotaxis protein CheB [Bacteroidota bacterium]
MDEDELISTSTKRPVFKKGRKKYELVVIGGSAGSIDAVLKILKNLRADFAIPIIIVLHRKASHEEFFVSIFQKKTALKVKEAEGHETILPGFIYVVPSDYHLLIEDDKTLTLDVSEKVNYSRPSIDITLECAADVFKERLIGVILTGANADGAKGLARIKSQSGFAIVQNPATAEVDTMPKEAIKSTAVDHILELEDIARFLNGIDAR